MTNLLVLLAGPKGFEPSTSGVTGRRSNRAELRPQNPYLLLNFKMLHFFHSLSRGRYHVSLTQTPKTFATFIDK